ncbi:hypothetical protein HZA57_05780 [Candidatus Poribacteria bacterium]|nr:hypothetical protein [Candidatus Poribacteria bacterium]
MCHPGALIPDTGIVTHQLLAEGAWGELWRAVHQSLGPVLFVAYSTVRGAEMFAESLAPLERIRNTPTAGLLKVLFISPDTAIPYVLLEDPGGQSLPAPGDAAGLPAPASVGAAIAALDAVEGATALGISPIGILPEFLLEHPGNERAPWRLAPVLPGCPRAAELLGGGQYAPPGLPALPNARTMNADTFAIGWILADSLNVLAPGTRAGDELAAATGMPRLAAIVQETVKERYGAYALPSELATRLRGWLQKDALKDLRQHDKALKKAAKTAAKPTKKPAKQRAPPKPKAGGPSIEEKYPGVVTSRSSGGGSGRIGLFLAAAFKILLLLGSIGGGVYGGYWLVTRAFSAPTTTKTPEGIARLYGEAIMAGDLPACLSYCSKDAKGDTPYIFQYLQGKPMAKVKAAFVGGPNDYAGVAEIRDKNDKLIVVLTMKVYKEGGHCEIILVDFLDSGVLQRIGIN